MAYSKCYNETTNKSTSCNEYFLSSVGLILFLLDRAAANRLNRIIFAFPIQVV